MLISGCGTHATIKALEPAEIDRAASLKQIGVLPFDERKGNRDSHNVNLGPKIEAKLASYQLDGTNYFTVVSRSDLDKLMDEQKFQRSGLVDESKIAELGRLAGAQALISGSVSSTSLNDSRHNEKRSRLVNCDSKGKNCQRQEYTVNCTIRTIGMGAQIRMVDVSRGDLVTAQTYTESKNWKQCSDTSTPLPALEQGIEIHSDKVANDFVSKITPRYITFKVKLIDKLDVKLEKSQEEKFKSAIAFIKADRLDRSEAIFVELLEETQQQSYAVAYNLGVVNEAAAKYQDAKNLYAIADSLTTKPVKQIDEAINRIEDLIAKQERAQEQMSR